MHGRHTRMRPHHWAAIIGTVAVTLSLALVVAWFDRHPERRAVRHLDRVQPGGRPLLRRAAEASASWLLPGGLAGPVEDPARGRPVPRAVAGPRRGDEPAGGRQDHPDPGEGLLEPHQGGCRGPRGEVRDARSAGTPTWSPGVEAPPRPPGGTSRVAHGLPGRRTGPGPRDRGRNRRGHHVEAPHHGHGDAACRPDHAAAGTSRCG